MNPDLKVKMTGMDWQWVLTCFGTAVGAGILFLPVSASQNGIVPLFILTLIIFPVTYVAHRGITRIVSSCPVETDIIGTVELDVGKGASFAVSILYFLSIISICIGYATGVTNVVQSFMEHQLGMTGIYRPLLTFILLFLMMLVILAGESFMVKVTSIITFPLIILLAFLSFYMIPYWNTNLFSHPIEWDKVPSHIFLLFPVLVFAMNFSPVCSTLGAAYRRQYPDIAEAVGHSDKVIKWTALILLIFVMFFVYSMSLSATPQMLDIALKENEDMLTSISRTIDKPFLQDLMPVISLLAIVSSYFGHFTGTREGVMGIITHIANWNKPKGEVRTESKGLKVAITLILTALLWFLAVYNPSILSIISFISAPIIAMYAYLMPVVLMRRVPRLFIYRSPWGAFVFVMGLVGICGGLLGKYLV